MLHLLAGFFTVLITFAVIFVIRERPRRRAQLEAIADKKEQRAQEKAWRRQYDAWCEANGIPVYSTEDFYREYPEADSGHPIQGH